LAFLLFEVFSFALSWIGILIGLVVGSPQAADAIASLPTFILGFVSNVFVDTAMMPAWLRWFANWNPVSALVEGGRQLFGKTIGPPPAGVWPLDHPIITTLGLSAAIVAITVPICVRRYSSLRPQRPVRCQPRAATRAHPGPLA
jgi:ABC-2 type transport system permease protein